MRTGSPRETARLAGGLLTLMAMTSLPLVAQAQAQTRPDATTLAASLQQRYDRVRDFSADFEHVYEGCALRMQATERGTVLIKKPGQMRWQYDAPEDKLFVSDGRTIYAHFPADSQVTVSAMPQADEASAAVLLLTGKGDLVRDFRAAYADLPDLAPESYALRLEPRSSAPEYEALTLVVDRDGLALQQLISNDRQGGTSTFRFSNLRENIGIADSRFAFTIPADVEVIRHDDVPN
ncbi:MAG: outer membrane lipoprotein carrier protein LolA [Acidobacteria bacterium]|mgnify:FL=1|nr:outer membrane lipoprotein carrier protein LolA [Acidobacteriota bacterium]